jgi:Family of unknown function (DUF5947)
MISAGNVGGSGKAFDVLRRFTRRPRRAEQCEMCGLEVAADHSHLLEIAHRRLICVCGACAILFSGQSSTKFKRVPQRICLLRGFSMTAAQWESLLIPINMAFFCRSSAERRVIAMYPSPAGATESLLPMDAWRDLELQNPPLVEMESDVEALLVNRIGEARGVQSSEYFVLPIDECYKLVGLIRTHWRGFSGGTEVWQEIGKFFARLRSVATIAQGDMHA